ncbi:cardiolipin synthase (CMP-forming)-like [Tubulanus polymorphus]|uniref:cardiolipin synthase (CMP-forming)-like n=1 Tax=Tubulanus polymorphus TaxID=672921 RepID=UPI003DA63E21
MLLYNTSRRIIHSTTIGVSYYWPCTSAGMQFMSRYFKLDEGYIQKNINVSKMHCCKSSGSHLLCRHAFALSWDHGGHKRKFHLSNWVGNKLKDNKILGDRDLDVRENILTIPNILTASRIVLAPILGYLVVQESFTWAAGLFVFAGLTDLADGQIARAYPCQRSAFGTALDPLADKILVTVLMATLTAVNLLPLPLALLIISRDILLVAGVCFIRYKTLPSPKTVARYFDVKLPTAELQPSLISKVNTAIQLSLVTATIAAPVFDYIDHPYLQGLWYLTAATTFCSGIGYLHSYMISNKHVKILKSKLSAKS